MEINTESVAGVMQAPVTYVRLILAVFGHSVLRVYGNALENAVFYIAVYGSYKP